MPELPRFWPSKRILQYQPCLYNIRRRSSNEQARMPTEILSRRIQIYALDYEMRQLQRPPPCIKQKFPRTCQADTGVRRDGSSEKDEDHTSELELFPSLPAQCSPSNLIESNFNNLFNTSPEIPHNNLRIPSRSVINNINNVHIPSNTNEITSAMAPTTNLSLMPKKYFSFIYSLNCAKNLATTTFVLQYAAKYNEMIILCLLEPELESNGLPPHHDPFTRFTPCQKPKCAIYIKTSKELHTPIIFSSGTSFLGCRILLSQSKPFVIYNTYSHGDRDTVFAELMKTDESSILIGDFNCHHL
jgi:hypothetical protein